MAVAVAVRVVPPVVHRQAARPAGFSRLAAAPAFRRQGHPRPVEAAGPAGTTAVQKMEMDVRSARPVQPSAFSHYSDGTELALVRTYAQFRLR